MIVLIMGVAGAGKTTIGRQLAEELEWRFCDADAFHSAENIDKLRQNLPLNDEDRRPWLVEIRAVIGEWIRRREQVVLACSVLKAGYRETITAGYEDHVQIIYLKASPDLLRQRLISRTGHFMGEALLRSQFDILEEPVNALVVDAAESPPSIIRRIRSSLKI